MGNDSITRTQVLHLAHLARLGLDESEVDRLTTEMGAILEYLDVLAAANLDGSEGPIGGVPLTELREDVPHNGLDRDVALGQSARIDLDGYLVPPFRGS